MISFLEAVINLLCYSPGVCALKWEIIQIIPPEKLSSEISQEVNELIASVIHEKAVFPSFNFAVYFPP